MYLFKVTSPNGYNCHISIDSEWDATSEYDLIGFFLGTFNAENHIKYDAYGVYGRPISADRATPMDLFHAFYSAESEGWEIEVLDGEVKDYPPKYPSRDQPLVLTEKDIKDLVEKKGY